MNESQRKKQRVPAPMQMVVGEDDDLIQWYQSFPSGQRQQQVKDAIRRGLGIPVHEQQAAPVQQRQTQHPDDGIVRELLSQNAALKEELDNTRKWAEEWITFFNSRFDQLAGGAPAQPVLEAYEDQLTQERVAERKNKLKKATW